MLIYLYKYKVFSDTRTSYLCHRNFQSALRMFRWWGNISVLWTRWWDQVISMWALHNCHVEEGKILSYKNTWDMGHSWKNTNARTKIPKTSHHQQNFITLPNPQSVPCHCENVIPHFYVWLAWCYNVLMTSVIPYLLRG